MKGANRWFAHCLAGIAFAIPAVAFGSDEDYEVAQASTVWVTPSVISPTTPFGRLILSGGEYFASYRGRTLALSEATIGLAPTDTVYLWYTRQKYLIKGRASTSRLRMSDNAYGARITVKKRSESSDSLLAIQFQTIRPGAADVTIGRSEASYPATENLSFGLIYNNGHAGDYRVTYNTVKAGESGKATVYSLGANRSFPTVGKLDSYLQGEIFVQNWTGVAVDSTRKTDVKASAVFGANYRLCRWLSLQGDFTLHPLGMPFAGSQMGALGSFLVYEPGGVTDGLRDKLVGYGSLRLVASGAF